MRKAAVKHTDSRFLLLGSIFVLEPLQFPFRIPIKNVIVLLIEGNVFSALHVRQGTVPLSHHSFICLKQPPPIPSFQTSSV